VNEGITLERRDLTILGGGPAGLATAFYATRAAVPFVLFERSKWLGGLCRTFRHGNHLYDSGAHRFHDRDTEITNDIQQLMSDELIAVDAPSKIFDRGRLVDFPPRPINIIFSGLSMVEAFRIGIDVVRSRRKRRRAVTFADFAIAQFGEILARRVLLNYSEKLWGLPADQLSPDVATRRLQGMSLRSLARELFSPRQATTHLDGTFLYPKQGYGRIVERIAATLPASSIKTEHEAVGVKCVNAQITQICFANRPPVAVSGRVISTLPLPVLANLLGDRLSEKARAAAERLRFRQIRLFFIRLMQTRASSSASIYVPDPKLCISRIYEPKNRSRWMAPEQETSLVVEVPCFEDDPLYHMEPDRLAERVIAEIGTIGIVDPAKVVEWRHHLLRNAYPVYTLDYADEVRTVREALKKIENLDLLGRGGLFFYSHLHDQLRFGKDYVNSLIA
jgi:protoporphyrinogen oxidase